MTTLDNTPDIGIYRVQIAQAGTDAPFIDYELQNTTGKTPTWARQGPGVYVATFPDLNEWSGKAWCEMGSGELRAIYAGGGGLSLIGYYNVQWGDTDGIIVTTYDDMLAPADDILEEYITVELKVYQNAIIN